MQDLKQSLLILNYFSLAIVERIQIIYYETAAARVEGKEFNDITAITLYQMNIINICGYLDEYDKELGVKSESEYQNKVDIAKKICLPFIKAIRNWSSLRERRNLYAHTLRKGGKLLLLDVENDSNADFPDSLPELMMLRNCFIQVQRILKSEFKEEFNQAVEELSLIKYIKKEKFDITYENFTQQYHEIVCKSMSIAMAYDRKYNYDIGTGWQKIE